MRRLVLGWRRVLPALFMNTAAAIADPKIRTHCGILSSRQDHPKSARPRKRGGDEPDGQRARPSDAPRTVGASALLVGACPRLSSGTGTAADVGASPLSSAHWSRDAAQRFRDEPS